MDHSHQDTDGRGDRHTRRSPFQNQRGDEAACETNRLGVTMTDGTDVVTDEGLRPMEAAGGSGDTAPSNSSGVCPVCGAVFSGLPGMRLHMRGAHPEVFHATAVATLQDLRNLLWTEEETRMMARFEMENSGERQINIFIQKNLFPQRTTNQVSCHRKGAKYREAVATARAEGNGNGGGYCGLGLPRAAAAATRLGDFGSPPWLAALRERPPPQSGRGDRTGDTKWTLTESEKMASFEQESSPTRINQKILQSGILGNRTLHAIKGHRRTAGYKQVLEALRNTAAERTIAEEEGIPEVQEVLPNRHDLLPYMATPDGLFKIRPCTINLTRLEMEHHFDTSSTSVDSLESRPTLGSLSEDSLNATTAEEPPPTPDSLGSVAPDSLDPPSPDQDPSDSSND